MSQLSGIVSLFLIAAAFLTSCDNQQSPAGEQRIVDPCTSAE